jgi:hypothetical protein
MKTRSGLVCADAVVDGTEQAASMASMIVGNLGEDMHDSLSDFDSGVGTTCADTSSVLIVAPK